MIAPLVPFGLRGVIWYQGEQNADGGGIAYRSLFQALIMDWRRHFGQGDLPFYFVQLPNYRARSEVPEESEWAVLREAQAMALALPRTGMAVTIDVGEAANIHPRDKFDVGYRLALNALALDYGYKIEYSGPLFQRLKYEGHRLRVVFSHADGLVTKDGKPPTAFAIAGADQKYVWANARIEGNSVVLWNYAVALPRSVR
jgi:sialate O-acetylesterase